AFITRTPLRFTGGIFGNWVYDPANAQIMAKNSPARTGLFSGGDTFQSIVLQQEGRNLRSDGQWLYYAHQNLIRRIKTDAPAVQLDYAAVGLEAIQVVQTYSNTVTLVSGKPTVVIGYAQTVTNTTGKTWRPKARVRAFRNGQLLSPSEAWSWNHPSLPAGADLCSQRSPGPDPIVYSGNPYFFNFL